MRHDIPKSLKRELRQLATAAYERELRRELEQLSERFDAWKRGEVDSFDLSDEIHRFHQRPNRDLWSRYTVVKPDASVPMAVAAGVLSEGDLSEQLRDFLAARIESCRAVLQ